MGLRNIVRLVRSDFKHLFSNAMSVIIAIGLVVMPSIFTWYNVIACWNVFRQHGQPDRGRGQRGRGLRERPASPCASTSASRWYRALARHTRRSTGRSPPRRMRWTGRARAGTMRQWSSPRASAGTCSRSIPRTCSMRASSTIRTRRRAPSPPRSPIRVPIRYRTR